MSTVLSNPGIRVDVVPAEGGRVQSVVDGVSGRELLYQRTPPPGERIDFMSGCPGGWDEMFPNDTPWRGHPDHGRVWSARCAVVETTPDRLRVHTGLATPAVEIEREYNLLPPPRRGVRLVIVLEARRDTGPFLWASHPMLHVGPGWTIAVGANHLDVDPEMPGRFDPGARISGQERERALRMPFPGEGWAEVLYATAVDSAEIRSPDGRSRTRLRWDDGYLRHLWIVTLTGELDVDLCLLFEPCTTRPYRLDDAILAREAASLRAGERREWWVELESLDG
jgi:hypothetical protein